LGSIKRNIKGFRLTILIGLISMLYPFILVAQIINKDGSKSSETENEKGFVNRIGASKMNDEKAADLLLKAIEFKKKDDIRNALKAFLQAFNYYEKTNNQTAQVNVLLELAEEYVKIEVPERAVEYYQRALIKVNSHQLSGYDLGEIYFNLGSCYQNLGNYEQAEAKYLAALQVASEKANVQTRRKILNSLGEIYQIEEKTSKLLGVNLDLLEIEKQESISSKLSLAYNNVGFVYKSAGNLKESAKYFYNAITTEMSLKKPDYRSLISMRINLASLLNQEGKFEAAQSELQKANLSAKLNNDIEYQSNLGNFSALLYFNKKDYQNAYNICFKAIGLAESSGKIEIKYRCYKTFALILERLGDFKEAYKYQELELALKDSLFETERKEKQFKLLNRINVERTEKELKLLLLDAERSEFELEKINLEAERKQKNIDILTKEKELQEYTFRTKALESEKVLQKSRILSQDLEKQRIMQELALEQFQNTFSMQKLQQNQKESKILLLEKEKKLLEKNRVLQQSQLLAQKSREKNLKIISILSGLIIVSVLFGLIIFRNKNLSLNKKQSEIQKVNAELEELNALMASKNKNITDSINYAKEIQTGILPETMKWNSVFPESYIFYQPKDIVSGDFYFLANAKNKWILAFADCTGHGVPGAFMSVIGHNLLTSITEIHGITDPSSILNQVDVGIRKTLKINENDSRDGMEMGICVFDFEKGILEFSSSMRPLYGIRNGSFFELPGTRKTLGMDFHHKGSFEKHVMPLKEVSHIYLCTDGYQDQLGGPEFKRFLSKSLKSLLTNNFNKPMAEQGEIIKENMKQWKGDGRQLDDILVIGIDIS